MKLTRIDRLEHIEDILQKHMAMTEERIESLGTMTDPEICRIRNMYLLDLGEIRSNLISIRHKVELEYAMRKTREEFHEQVQSFTESSHVGRCDETNIRERWIRGYPPCAGNRRTVQNVGRYGGHIPEDGQGDPGLRAECNGGRERSEK